jgi:hypothetical protein
LLTGSRALRLLFIPPFAYVCHKFRMAWPASTDAEKGEHSTPFIPPPAGGAATMPQYGQPQEQPQQPKQFAQETSYAVSALTPSTTGYSTPATTYAQPTTQSAYAQPTNSYELGSQSTGYSGASVYSPNTVGQQYPSVTPPPPAGVHQLPTEGHTPGPQIYQLPAQ